MKTVAVIGCGPGGMSFLHAHAMKKAKLEAAGDEEGLARLPIVTVYERSSSPGGVWRSDSTNYDNINGIGNDPAEGNDAQPEKKMVKDEDTKVSNTDSEDSTSVSSSDSEDEEYIVEGATDSSTNMYEALWTNGPSQAIEFFDYTYEDHFKRDMPTFMTRRSLLEYMLARYTRNNPDFFTSVRFNTSVENVVRDEVTKTFEIYSIDKSTNEQKTEHYDLCIWAAGLNGAAKIPASIRKTLHEGQYKGPDVHSSVAGDLLATMKGKKVLFIGDSYSSEDLALQAIKLGVEKIYIFTRRGEGICSYTKAWPGGKVEIIYEESEQAVSEVIQDGYGLRFTTKIGEDSPLPETGTVVDNRKVYDIHDISAVIYCTGYEENIEMLDEIYMGEEGYDGYDSEDEGYPNDLPENWKMEPNAYSEVLGDVEPTSGMFQSGEYFDADQNTYRGIDLKFPGLLYLCEAEASMPLLEIDVRAWFLLKHIMDNVLTEAEMRSRKRTDVHEALQFPEIRYELDENYKEAMKTIDEEHWSADPLDPRARECSREAMRWTFQLLAGEMQDAEYPFTIGTRDRLNEKGEFLMEMNIATDEERYRMDDYPEEEQSWRTFRDLDPSGYKSLHSGRAAASLKARWLDIDDADPNKLVANQEVLHD